MDREVMAIKDYSIFPKGSPWNGFELYPKEKLVGVLPLCRGAIDKSFWGFKFISLAVFTDWDYIVCDLICNFPFGKLFVKALFFQTISFTYILISIFPFN